MPDATKVRWAQLKVGLMALFAMAILIYLIFLLYSTLGFLKSKSPIFTYLGDANGLAAGVDVALNGLPIGTVEKVELSGLAQPGRVVKITLKVDNDRLSSIPVDSEAGLDSANLLGNKYVNIIKGKSSQTVTPGSEIASVETQDLLKQGSATLGALQNIVTRLDAIVGQVELGKGNLGKLLVDEQLFNNALAISEEFKNLATDLHQTINSSDNSVGKLLHDNGAVYDEAQKVIARVNSIAQGLDEGKGTMGRWLKTDQLADDTHALLEESRQTLVDARKLLAGIDTKSDDLNKAIQGTISRLDTTLDKINNGNGTISKLLNDSTTSEDLDALMREMQGLMKDFRANPRKFLRIELKLF